MIRPIRTRHLEMSIVGTFSVGGVTCFDQLKCATKVMYTRTLAMFTQKAVRSSAGQYKAFHNAFLSLVRWLVDTYPRQSMINV